MSFANARNLATQAAAMARAQNTDQAVALLADAISELSRSLGQELPQIKQTVEHIKRNLP